MTKAPSTEISMAHYSRISCFVANFASLGPGPLGGGVAADVSGKRGASCAGLRERLGVDFRVYYGGLTDYNYLYYCGGSLL